MKVTAQYAEEHFADILRTAVSGEDVEIAMPEKPSVRLTLIKTATPVVSGEKTRPLGRLKGILEPPIDEEWSAMDFDSNI
jgi:antitoxin (DNA-binding transcriptional repressor) of toxin-antitoxin stability system